jgi:hypothetical protein
MLHRIWKIAVVAAAALCAAPAGAADNPSAPLAPDEVLLELASTGVAHNHADTITVDVSVSATAATPAEARHQVAAQVDRLLVAARASGVAAEDIKVENSQRYGFAGNEAYTAEEPPVPPKPTATLVIELRLHDVGGFPALRDALEAAGAAHVPEPDFSLSDDRVAREEAKADALRKARGEAEAYAHSLGLRVVRVVRVSEREAPQFSSPAGMRDMMKMLNGGGNADGDVETMVNVAMDFVLGPAR